MRQTEPPSNNNSISGAEEQSRGDGWTTEQYLKKEKSLKV